MLVYNGIFDYGDIGTPAMEFYIRDIMESGDDCIWDIDRHAYLNTLFGYEIGRRAAMLIDHWLWCSKDEDGEVRDIETLELTYRDKDLIQRCVEEQGLGLSFEKWRTTDVMVYEYYQ